MKLGAITFVLMTIQEKFGRNVSRKRKRNKISQEEFARLSGVERSYISSIERGNRNVSISVAYKISQALEVSIDDLIQ